MIYPNTQKNNDCLVTTVYSDEFNPYNIQSLTLRVHTSAVSLINKSKKRFPHLTFGIWDRAGIPVDPNAYHLISIEGSAKDLAGYRQYILNGDYHSLAG